MSKTQKTKTTQTTTPNAPSWTSPQVESLATKTANLSNQDPYSFVAGADPLQTQAAQGAGGITQNSQSYNTANDVLTRQANSGSDPYAVATVHPNSILPNLEAYMSPYTNDVVKTSLADYDFGAGQQLAQAKLSAGAADDTFGGSNTLFTDSLLGGQIARGRGTLSAGLRDQAFDTGSSLAGQDADRRQQAQLANQAAYNQARQFGVTSAQSAAGQLVNTDTARTADARATAGTQSDIGSILQQLAQARAGAPINTQGSINSAYGSLTPMQALLTGQTTNGTSKSSTGGLGSAISSLGSLAAGLGAIGFAPFTGGASLAALPAAAKG